MDLASCSKGLDIQRETEERLDGLLSAAAGFEEALLGVYSRCTENDL